MIEDGERERLAGEQAAKLDEALQAIFRRLDALPDLDSRSADEIIGYDENGLPG